MCHSCLILSRSILWPLSVFESCCCSIAQSCPNLCDPCTVAHQAPLSSTNSLHLFKFMSIDLVMLSNHLILCHPLLLLTSVLPSIRVFFSESALCIRWPKSQSFSISLSKEYSGLISFRNDWFDLLAVQGALKSLPSTTVRYFSAQPSLWSKSHICNDYWKNHSPDYMGHWQSDISAF